MWRLLVEAGVWRPPRPEGRIPNFIGAEVAARRITSLRVWRAASIVKINPDSPQRPLREAALREGKALLMPTPRLRSGFLLLNPSSIPAGAYRQASTIKGAFRYGILLDTIDKIVKFIDKVDLVVEGSVAVNLRGERLGKGEGYGDLEYGILSELGLLDAGVVIATTVHELQVLPCSLPQAAHDVRVNIVATPSRVIETSFEADGRPKGILWEALEEEKVKQIPLLAQLKRWVGRG